MNMEQFRKMPLLFGVCSVLTVILVFVSAQHGFWTSLLMGSLPGFALIITILIVNDGERKKEERSVQ